MRIKIEVSSYLKKEMRKKFGIKISLEFFKLFNSRLKENPNAGKRVGRVNNILIKELKYESFRFYYLVDGEKLKLVLENELTDLLIKFVNMSKKDNQKEIIGQIKEVLINMGFK